MPTSSQQQSAMIYGWFAAWRPALVAIVERRMNSQVSHRIMSRWPSTQNAPYARRRQSPDLTPDSQSQNCLCPVFLEMFVGVCDFGEEQITFHQQLRQKNSKLQTVPILFLGTVNCYSSHSLHAQRQHVSLHQNIPCFFSAKTPLVPTKDSSASRTYSNIECACKKTNKKSLSLQLH